MNYEMISSKGEETLAQLASRLGGASHADFGLEAACAGRAGGYFYGQGGAPKGQRKGSQGVARQDGQLTVEREFFGRSLREEAGRSRRKGMVFNNHPRLSISQQCSLLGISRSAWYRRQSPENSCNLALMRVIDALFLEEP